jgi:hypothetical protein
MELTRYPCQILIKLKYSGQFFSENTHVKFRESAVEVKLFPWGRTDGQTGQT